MPSYTHFTLDERNIYRNFCLKGIAWEKLLRSLAKVLPLSAGRSSAIEQGAAQSKSWIIPIGTTIGGLIFFPNCERGIRQMQKVCFCLGIQSTSTWSRNCRNSGALSKYPTACVWIIPGSLLEQPLFIGIWSMVSCRMWAAKSICAGEENVISPGGQLQYHSPRPNDSWLAGRDPETPYGRTLVRRYGLWGSWQGTLSHFSGSENTLFAVCRNSKQECFID